jgi:hypothetical protein
VSGRVSVALEFRREDVILRVDGDVLEVFRRGTFSERILLAWLAADVQPSLKGSLIVKIACTPEDRPLYEVLQKARARRGAVVELVIKTEEEPFCRQFFNQVAQLRDRSGNP